MPGLTHVSCWPGRPATWGWKSVCSSKPAAMARRPGQGKCHRQGDWPAHLLPRSRNPETGLPPLTPRSVPISQSLGLGARVCCGAWVRDVALLRGDAATALPWASQLGHSVSCNDALSEPRQLSFISHSKKMFRRWSDPGECVTANLSGRNLGCL